MDTTVSEEKAASVNEAPVTLRTDGKTHSLPDVRLSSWKRENDQESNNGTLSTPDESI